MQARDASARCSRSSRGRAACSRWRANPLTRQEPAPLQSSRIRPAKHPPTNPPTRSSKLDAEGWKPRRSATAITGGAAWCANATVGWSGGRCGAIAPPPTGSDCDGKMPKPADLSVLGLRPHNDLTSTRTLSTRMHVCLHRAASARSLSRFRQMTTSRADRNRGRVFLQPALAAFTLAHLVGARSGGLNPAIGAGSHSRVGALARWRAAPMRAGALRPVLRLRPGIASRNSVRGCFSRGLPPQGFSLVCVLR